MFYNTCPESKMDHQVRRLCEDKVNCRRKKMLEAIGSMEECEEGKPCCDCCGLVAKLRCEEQCRTSTVGRKRRCAPFTVTNEAVNALAQALRREQDAYLQNHPDLLTFGPDCVCSDTLIDHVPRLNLFTKKVTSMFSSCCGLDYGQLLFKMCFSYVCC